MSSKKGVVFFQKNIELSIKGLKEEGPVQPFSMVSV